MTDEPTRRTLRRYAHELYPHPDEGPLAVEVPYLYARAQGLRVFETGWYDMLAAPSPMPEIAAARTSALVQAGLLALLADALHQGLAGDEAWEWALVRAGGDSLEEWVWDRGTRYGVDLDRIKPYPCGPEPDHHDHMETTGNAMGYGFVTRVPGRESECLACTEPVEAVR